VSAEITTGGEEEEEEELRGSGGGWSRNARARVVLGEYQRPM